MLEKQILRNYEKGLRSELPQYYFIVLTDLLASSRLEYLFDCVGLEFVSYRDGLAQTEEKPRMVKLGFKGKEYFIPKSAFIPQEGQEIFVWLDGYYARARWEGREFLTLIDEKTFADLPLGATIYEAIRVGDDNGSLPLVRTSFSFNQAS
jgi:hypothetical protein